MKPTIIIKEKEIDVDIESIVQELNKRCKYLNFKSSAINLIINEELIEYPYSFVKLNPNVRKEIENSEVAFLLTNKQYDNNFFYEEHSQTIILSFHGWEYLTNLSKNNGLVYFISNVFAQGVYQPHRHKDNIGCLYDFLSDKTLIDKGMRSAQVCSTCLNTIQSRKLPEQSMKILEDLRIIMNDLSSSSKWNLNIVDYWSKEENGSKTIPKKKRKPKKEGEIHVLIASPSDTHLERKLLLEQLERKFRLEKYEELTKYRLFTHGWEELASETGYAQDLINENIFPKIDIVLALFKHKLGTPTINIESGVQRAKSGTVEELFYAIQNEESKTLSPVGMCYFYSTPPNPSFESPDFDKQREEWDKLKKFKKEIGNSILYKPYNDENELLDISCKDLVTNIQKHFKK